MGALLVDPVLVELPANRVTSHLAELDPYFTELGAVTPARMSAIQLAVLVAAGGAHAFMLMLGGAIRGLVVVEIVGTEPCKRCVVTGPTAVPPALWSACLPALEAWATEAGCISIVLQSPPEGAAPGGGYRVSAIQFERELAPPPTQEALAWPGIDAILALVTS